MYQDDADREYVHDRNSSTGRLDEALHEAKAKERIVVRMKNDWKTNFPAFALKAGNRPKRDKFLATFKKEGT